ncbi:MAG: hypothetical protein IPL99_12120 [Candidatus Competibacteraceae bacterium]|nr:hypothetical protein [Candidatus Competibacteraceae bacterium]
MSYLIGMDINFIRRNNLHRLLELHTDQNSLAEALGTLQGRISDFLSGRRNVGNAIARRTEQAHQLPHGWMDVEHSDDAKMEGKVDLRADQIQLLHFYEQLSPDRQRVIRETASAYTVLEQIQQQQQQQQ